MSGAALAQIKAGELAPVYVLYGPERGLMRAWIEAIRAAAVDESFAAFNHERFAGRELETPTKVIDACMQVPLMAKLRLVELDEPEAIGKGRGPADPKLLDPLIAYLAAPNPSTVLLVVSSGIDARSRIVTATKKTGVVEKFEGLRRNDEAVSFLVAHAREVGVGLEPAAANAIVERIGTSPSALVGALEQATLYAGVDVRVTAAHVAAVVVDAREAVVFDLTDAVGMGRHERAVAVARRIFSDGDNETGEAMRLVGLLARQLRLLMLAQGVGLRSAEVAARGGMPPFLAQKVVEQARQFSAPRLHRAFAALARLDGDLKGGSHVTQKAPSIAIERWILEACDALVAVAPR
jgi:DNA polymerase-3 subunit delta